MGIIIRWFNTPYNDTSSYISYIYIYIDFIVSSGVYRMSVDAEATSVRHVGVHTGHSGVGC